MLSAFFSRFCAKRDVEAKASKGTVKLGRARDSSTVPLFRVIFAGADAIHERRIADDKPIFNVPTIFFQTFIYGYMLLYFSMRGYAHGYTYFIVQYTVKRVEYIFNFLFVLLFLLFIHYIRAFRYSNTYRGRTKNSTFRPCESRA